MSELQRCLIRNSVIGSITAFLCYLMYGSMLSDMYPGGHTALTLALLVTSCTTCFSTGFIACVKTDDPPFFKYVMGGARVVAPTTTMFAFIGLLYFSWLGLAGGFVIGAWLSVAGLKFIGSDAVKDDHCLHNNYSNQLTHYYCKAASMPLLIILPLAFGGLLLFEWWGLGAGFIGGALISTLTLTLWGPQKPSPPAFVPDQVEESQHSRVQSHHNHPRASRIKPGSEQVQPNAQKIVIITSSTHPTNPIDIPTARNPALDATGKLNPKHLPPKKPLYSQSI